jgi:hypothetical protein
MHDGVEVIEDQAFCYCVSLRGINLPGVRVIGKSAFNHCEELADVEFGEKLETVEGHAFVHTALRNIKLPNVRVIEDYVFHGCKHVTEVELSEDLERIGGWAFQNSPLRRIVMPLKDNMFRKDVFYRCENLSQVDLIGGVHKTVSSLLLGSWRNEMSDEIDRINRDLPYTPTYDKTAAIRQWMELNITNQNTTYH